MSAWTRCTACCVADKKAEEKGLATVASSSMWFNIPENTKHRGEDSSSSKGELVEKGPVELDNGVTYIGQWRDGHRHGHGIIVRPDGGKYEGQFENDRACGSGKFAHSNGDLYDGQWLNDKAHGKGKFLLYAW
eukprot:CAMPEP_0185905558 /NCGR_PEP_ID=MMETSP0196C-20130402/4766_1 /TAXON_ID=2932 /ORGANISM="Alexandrium fundyense, Strain CCMP1719" /LENGTH=132 /DNA_ID=CAMNT_0028625115 /DNA_START=100 /DNA_END=495 /DNA_ORIENTATION=-